MAPRFEAFRRRAAQAALRRGLPRLARRLVAPLHAADPRDVGLLHILALAAEAAGDAEAGARYRAERLRHLMPQYLKSRDLTGILRLMAEMERTGQAAQFRAGCILAEELGSEAGRARLLKAARAARKRFRESAFLSHVIALCQAMAGDHMAAGRALVEEINSPPPAPDWLQARRFRLLEQSWRVVDLIARERMDWADETGDYEGLTGPAGAGAGEGATPRTAPETGLIEGAETLLSFKEHALQGRLRDQYLEICDRDFEAVGDLPARLSAVQAMLRTSIRHSPDYSASFARAAQRLDSLSVEIETLFQPCPQDPVGAEQQVLTLCTLLRLARRLDRPALAIRIAEQLEALSALPEYLPLLRRWPATTPRWAGRRGSWRRSGNSRRGSTAMCRTSFAGRSWRRTTPAPRRCSNRCQRGCAAARAHFITSISCSGRGGSRQRRISCATSTARRWPTPPSSTRCRTTA